MIQLQSCKYCILTSRENMHKFFILLTLALIPFSSFTMEKEKPIRIRSGMRGMYAAEDVNADQVMRALMDKKPESEIIDLLNTSPLNINSLVRHERRNAVRGGLFNQEVISILKCTIEYCNPNNKKHIQLIESILEKGALLEQPADDCWDPYLITALKVSSLHENNLNIVKLLVDSGANVNFRFTDNNGYGDSALDEAIRHYYINAEDIKYLLKLGADPNNYNKEGITTLAALAKFKKIHEAKVKDKNGSWQTIHLGSEAQFKNSVTILLEYGADITKKQKIYDSQTNQSVEKSNYELLKPLVPELDDIIEKVETNKETNKLKIKTAQKYILDFTKAAENNLYAHQSIIIANKSFNLSASITGSRCPALCYQLNPNYLPQERPQYPLGWNTAIQVD